MVWDQPGLGETGDIAVLYVSLELNPHPEVIQLVFQRWDAVQENAGQWGGVVWPFPRAISDAGSTSAKICVPEYFCDT